MDVSPKTLREVEFREKMRGYHPEDVDQFLERVAAGIEVLQDRLRQAIERAQRAEQAATEAGGNDDALRRTLLLAQRTADLAVQEAREQAARIIASAEQQTQAAVAEVDQHVSSVIADAEQRAQATVGDAEQRAQAMISDGENQARRGHEDVLVEVRNDLAELEMTRQRLQMDVDTLARWVLGHRAQLRAALEDALTRVDQIDLSPPTEARPPHPDDPLVDGPNPNIAVAQSPGGPAPAGENQPASQPQTNPEPQWAPPPVDAGQPAAPAAPVAPTAPAAEEPFGPWQPEPESGGDAGVDSDPYFAELRRAISDPDPLTPRPEGGHQAATGGSAPEP